MAGDDQLNGSQGDDTLACGDVYVKMDGCDGNDILDGGIGNDWLAGNTGNDTLAGGDGDDTFFGSWGADILVGGDGRDQLDGGGGADRMSGGLGDYVYVVDHIGDVVEEFVAEGRDTVQSSMSYTLSANLENLTVTGTALDGTGNETRNVIAGNSRNNVLSGLGGKDDLFGGDGNDTLIGGAGADEMAGDAGDDLYLYGAGDTIFEEAGAGVDTVRSSLTCALTTNVENLNLTGNTAVDGTGNELDNFLKGNASSNTLRGMTGNDRLNGGDGNDILDGGAGADDMGGGLGADLYIVDDLGDVAAESDGDGAVDTVQASVSHTLTANIENLTLTGAAAIDGTGNARANVIVGNGVANLLSGKGGADALTGGDGNDTFRFDTPLVAGVVTTIADMTHGIDQIALGQAVFMEAGPIGRLASSAFYIGAAAHDSSDRIIYNAVTGDLIYDPDGGRSQPGTVFANVGPGLALNAGDFRVV
jgi:Ca2+-binding RTX toxin-like protein